MKQFKEFLIKEYQDREKQTNPRGKVLSREEALNLLRTKAKKAWKQFVEDDQFISRVTFSGRDDYTFLDTSKQPARMSRNTDNYYTHIINKDPDWKKYPRRQIIGTAGFRGTGNAKNTYVYFPYDGTPVGITKRQDIWYSFPALQKLNISFAHEFNMFIKSLLNTPNTGHFNITDQPKKYDKNLKTFKQKAKQFDWWFAGGSIEGKDKEMARKMNQSSIEMDRTYGTAAKVFFRDYYDGDLYEAIKKVYSPKGFKLQKSGNLNMNMDKSPEVWFDGPAVIIQSQLANELKKSDEV